MSYGKSVKTTDFKMSHSALECLIFSFPTPDAGKQLDFVNMQFAQESASVFTLSSGGNPLIMLPCARLACVWIRNERERERERKGFVDGLQAARASRLKG